MPHSHLDLVEHRRDVVAIVVFHKAQALKVPHLARLRHPLRVSTWNTRTVLSGGDAVEVPRSHGCQHQCTFAGRLQDVELVHSRGASRPGIENYSKTKLY
ncbi:hypothetical protein E2C01_053752 [Portunus trituberculatus]|uniref:Uncharacterized protein n=1 Tax=Portunus trituberculatus TaxID=210409 RepID=A0A5B7GT41_PORTR|nr:hypothetical protein [Portunus trituberculatus]